MGCGVPPGGCQGGEGQICQHDQNPNIFGSKVAHEHGASFALGADHFFVSTSDTLTRVAFKLGRLHVKMTAHILGNLESPTPCYRPLPRTKFGRTDSCKPDRDYTAPRDFKIRL